MRPRRCAKQRGEHEPYGDGLAVPQVGGGRDALGLEGMSQRVPVVEGHPPAVLALVGRHDLGLDGDAAGHLLVDRELEQRGVGHLAQERVLRHLAAATGPVAGGQRRERRRVTQHGGRLPERAGQVLALGQVHPGLAPDRRVDLAQERGGHVHICGAAVIGGSREPGDVGDDPATHGDDHVAAGETRLGEGTAERLDRAHRLRGLAVADQVDLGGQPRIELGEPGGLRDGALGHDRGLLGVAQALGDHAGQLMADVGPDQHVVGPIGQRHGDDDHLGTAATRRTNSATCAASSPSTSTTASATSA